MPSVTNGEPPLLNIRWTDGVAYFVAPAAVAGAVDSGVRGAVLYGVGGLVALVAISLLAWVADYRGESPVASVAASTFAAVVFGLLAAATAVGMAALGPVFVGGLAAGGTFVFAMKREFA